MPARKTDDCHVTNASPTDSIRPAERVFSRPAIIAAAFLGLHILPLFWPSSHMWGVDFLYYIPAPVQVAFVLLAVLLFVPRFQRLCRACVTSLPFALWGHGRRVWISRALVILIALAGFFLLSSARNFLGDGYRLMQAPGADKWTSMLRAPLTYTSIQKLHNIGGAIWGTVENTYRTYSYASGVLYVLFAFPIATVLGKNTLERAILLAFLLTAGYIQLFFGYVENYALYMPGLLLYLYLGLRTCKDRAPLFLPALLLGLLLALHRGFLVFGPSLFYLAYRVFRSRQGRIPPWKNVLETTAALGCVPASGLLFLTVSGVGVHDYFLRAGGSHFLPLIDDPGFLAQYRIFSLTHIVDWLNQQLLVAPAACMALFLLRKKDLSHHPFLAFCTVLPLFFSSIGNPELGAFRDWDAWSLPAPPFTLWVAALALNRIRDGTDLSRGAFLLCGAAALHSCVWVGMNSSAAAAEARFVHLTERLRVGASVDAWMAVGNVRRQEKRYEGALHAYKQARDADPANPNRWLLVGATYWEMGQSDNAIEFYKKAQELQPDLPIPYMNLGLAYREIKQFDKAFYYTRKAIALDPDLTAAHLNLGAIYRETGQLKEAIETLETAVALRPQHATSRAHLGAAYRDAGRLDDAVEQLSSAIALQPDHLVAYVDLGFIYKRHGQYKLAVEHFKKALALEGDQANAIAYLNIGDTYFKMRELDRAIPYFQKTVELNPKHANSHLLLGLSYRALKRGEQARVHFEKTLELDPDHPQAAQIRQWLEPVGERR